MDGPHDLGGKQRFGHIKVTDHDNSFHNEWEGRMWAISNATNSPDWTIDWWRHVRELICEQDYLNRPYFDSWAQTQLAAFIDSGVFTLEEAINGGLSQLANEKPAPQNTAEILSKERELAFRFDGAVENPPSFRVGADVKTDSSGHDHHTRLPGYARGKVGVIHAHHGAHIFPDLSAQGIEEFHNLYSVKFLSNELWPEQRRSRDSVYIDLWEDYLTHA